MNQRPRDHS